MLEHTAIFVCVFKGRQGGKLQERDNYNRRCHTSNSKLIKFMTLSLALLTAITIPFHCEVFQLHLPK